MASVEVSSVSACRPLIPATCELSGPRGFINLKFVKKISRGGIKVRVCSRIRDLEIGVLDLENYVGLYGEFSAPAKLSTSSATKQGKEDEEKQNYYVNTGYAIRTLREEFPNLFHKELSFDIYRDDVVFKDPLNTFVGIENYKSIFWGLRFHGRIFFRALWVDLLSVWQPAESIIMVRWTVRGIPRILWESQSRFDGVSEYKLDKNGKIYEHRVHNIALNGPPKFQVLGVEELIQSIGCPSTPRPTYFKISLSSVMNVVLSFFKSAKMRDYLTLVFALTWKPDPESSRRI